MTRKKGSRSNGYYLPVSLDQFFRQRPLVPPHPPMIGHPPAVGHTPGPGFHPPMIGHPPAVGHPPGPGYHPPGPGHVGPPGPPPTYVSQPPHVAGYQGPGGGPGGAYHDPHRIRYCLYRYVYIWPRYGRPFWAYPTSVQWNAVSGFRWRQRFGTWEPFTLNFGQIANYQCT